MLAPSTPRIKFLFGNSVYYEKVKSSIRNCSVCSKYQWGKGLLTLTTAFPDMAGDDATMILDSLEKVITTTKIKVKLKLPNFDLLFFID